MQEIKIFQTFKLSKSHSFTLKIILFFTGQIIFNFYNPLLVYCKNMLLLRLFLIVSTELSNTDVLIYKKTPIRILSKVQRVTTVDKNTNYFTVTELKNVSPTYFTYSVKYFLDNNSTVAINNTNYYTVGSTEIVPVSGMFEVFSIGEMNLTALNIVDINEFKTITRGTVILHDKEVVEMNTCGRLQMEIKNNSFTIKSDKESDISLDMYHDYINTKTGKKDVHVNRLNPINIKIFLSNRLNNILYLETTVFKQMILNEITTTETTLLLLNETRDGIVKIINGRVKELEGDKTKKIYVILIILVTILLIVTIIALIALIISRRINS